MSLTGVKLHIHLWNVVGRFIFSSVLQIWYVEVRISRSISVSPLDFEITRVDFFRNPIWNMFMLLCIVSVFIQMKYSWLSLSRPRLSRITAYLEAKIWSLPIYENLTTDGKYCRKEEKLLLRSNFSSFPQYFQYISNFKSPITYQFVKCG